MGSGAMTKMFSSSTLPSDAWSRSHSDSFSHLSGLQEKRLFSAFHKWQFVQGISDLALMDIEYHVTVWI
jgi:hypothetical protein